MTMSETMLAPGATDISDKSALNVWKSGRVTARHLLRVVASIYLLADLVKIAIGVKHCADASQSEFGHQAVRGAPSALNAPFRFG